MLRGIITNHIEVLRKKDARLLVLYLAGFILSISANVAAYINSSFIEGFIGLEYVGLFFVAANLVTLFVMLYFPIIIKKYSNLISSKIVMLINVISASSLIFLNSPYWILPFFVAMWVSANLLWINMDIFVESFTSNINTGRVRAIFFTAMNFGWIVSPVIASSLVIDENYYRLVYLASVIFLIIFYLIINRYKKILNREDIIYKKLKIVDTIKEFWRDKNLRGVYIISFFLSIFFGLVVVYMPIYLNEYIGFNWSTIGIIFSIMLIPFVLVEIPAGYLADKYWGEIEMLNIGFTIIVISLLLFFFTSTANALIWTLILFFSRIGAALIEAMRESRFFKIVDVEHVSHINFLRTSYPLGFVFAAGIGVLILNFYSIEYLFLFLAVFFLSAFYFINIIRDSK
jgi:MFS family permease